EITKRLFSLLNSMILNSATSSTFNGLPSSLIECLLGQKPSTPYCNATISPLSPTLITVPSWIEPSVKMVSNVSQGFSSNCLCPRESLRFSSSSSKTTTSNVSPTLVNSLGWLIFLDQERSEIWIKPSIPSSNSTNTPKLVMFFTTADCLEPIG